MAVEGFQQRSNGFRFAKTTAEKYPDNIIFPLQSNYSYSPSQVHLIGHSLGTHVAGEAGRKTSKITIEIIHMHVLYFFPTNNTREFVIYSSFQHDNKSNSVDLKSYKSQLVVLM